MNNYLILEPSVFVNIKEDKSLLYNSANGNKVYLDDKNIIEILRRNPNSLNVFPISEKETKNGTIRKFIQLLEDNDMGFLERNKNISPVNFSPTVKILSAHNDSESYSDLCLSNLNTLSIYVNQGTIANHYHKENFYRQSLCNIYGDSYLELGFIQLQKNLNSLMTLKTLARINILGGNIFEYSFFDKLFQLLFANNENTQLCVYLDLQNFLPYREKLNTLLFYKNLKFVICISEKISTENLKELMAIIPPEKIEINCFIKSQEEFIFFSEVLENMDIIHNFVPFYDKNNISFFQENVFVTQSEIDDLFLNQQQVLKNKTLNSYYFGKLIILPNGDVFSNINSEMIGNIYQSSMAEITNIEMKQNGNWFLLRANVSPCSECIYNILCPPISDYEFVLKRNNLCHLWKD